MAKTPNGRNWADAPNLRNPPSSSPIRPMPRTSMPDRVDPQDQQDYGSNMKAGMSSTGNGDPTRKR